MKVTARAAILVVATLLTACSGSDSASPSGQPCPDCGGTGKISKAIEQLTAGTQSNESNTSTLVRPCPRCKGTGRVQ
jgi:DnaJ-class molecular chaperone